MERILVTGGAGYIGSHCCKVLAEAGFEPVTFDNLATGHRSFVRWGPLIEGDVRDGEALTAALEATAPVAVMHFAARSIVPESFASPEATFDVNVAGTLNLLRAMLRTGVSNIVFSSTCAVYGEPDRHPLTEGTGFAPISPYGASKAIAERMVDDVGTAHGIRSARLRYFNAAGADRDGEIGEQHEPETHLIPIILDVALGLRPALQIFGDRHPTPDGTAIRDYIHVLDLARIHLAALRHLLDGGRSCAVNVGTGVGASVAEVVRAVERVTGRRVPTVVAPPRAGDPAILTADPSAAKELFRWSASHTLDDIVADAWRWHVQMRADLAKAA